MTEVPHLRIVDDDLWQAVKARQASTRRTMKTGIVRAHRPKYLFSGLTVCGTCGGGYQLASHDRLTCFNSRVRGTCTNQRRIKRQEVEARVLRAMRERFFEPQAFAEFCKGFTDQMTLLRREHVEQMAGARGELAAIERRSKEILELLLLGYRDEAWKTELANIEERRITLKRALAEPPLAAMHPQMAEVYRQKTNALAAGLEDDDQRDAARQALRGFVEKIVIPPGDGLLQVMGNLGAMLDAAQGRAVRLTGTGAIDGCGGLQPTGLGVSWAVA